MEISHFLQILHTCINDSIQFRTIYNKTLHRWKIKSVLVAKICKYTVLYICKTLQQMKDSTRLEANQRPCSCPL